MVAPIKYLEITLKTAGATTPEPQTWTLLLLGILVLLKWSRLKLSVG